MSNQPLNLLAASCLGQGGSAFLSPSTFSCLPGNTALSPLCIPAHTPANVGASSFLQANPSPHNARAELRLCLSENPLFRANQPASIVPPQRESAPLLPPAVLFGKQRISIMGTTIVGREPKRAGSQLHIKIPTDGISDEHVRLEIEFGRVRLINLSTRGTTITRCGRPFAVEEEGAILQHGDRIRMGSIRCEFHAGIIPDSRPSDDLSVPTYHIMQRRPLPDKKGEVREVRIGGQDADLHLKRYPLSPLRIIAQNGHLAVEQWLTPTDITQVQEKPRKRTHLMNEEMPLLITTSDGDFRFLKLLDGSVRMTDPSGEEHHITRGKLSLNSALQSSLFTRHFCAKLNGDRFVRAHPRVTLMDQFDIRNGQRGFLAHDRTNLTAFYPQEILERMDDQRIAWIDARWRIEIRRPFSHRQHILLQHGQHASRAASVGMMLLDQRKQISLRDLLRNDHDTTMFSDLAAAGLSPFLTPGPLSLPTIEQQLRERGAGILTIDDPEVLEHTIVIDQIDLKGETALIRDPFHGWQIRVQLKALEKRKPRDLLQTSPLP